MPRGGKREGAGRPKGLPNKVTREVRAALKLLVEENVEEMHDWFKRQWKTDDGGKVAATLLSRLIEFAAPKLQRTDRAPQEADGPKSADEMSDAELEAIVAAARESPDRIYQQMVFGKMAPDVATKALKGAAQSGAPREASAADFGMTEPDLAPRALPAPQSAPLAAVLEPIPEPAPRITPAGAVVAAPPTAVSVEGEVLGRDAPAEIAAAPSRQATRRTQMTMAFQEYLQRVEEYTAEQRAARNDPSWHPLELELRLALGPRPPNPASMIWF